MDPGSPSPPAAAAPAAGTQGQPAARSALLSRDLVLPVILGVVINEITDAFADLYPLVRLLIAVLLVVAYWRLTLVLQRPSRAARSVGAGPAAGPPVEPERVGQQRGVQQPVVGRWRWLLVAAWAIAIALVIVAGLFFALGWVSAMLIVVWLVVVVVPIRFAHALEEPLQRLAYQVAAVSVGAALSIGGGAARQPLGPTLSTWQAVTSSSQVAPGVARTPDGLLHLAFRDADGHRLLHVAVKDGRPRPLDVIADGWGGLNPTTALVARRDGSLQVFFGGTPPQSYAADFTHIKTATSNDGGRTWSAYQQTRVHLYAYIHSIGTATLGGDGRAIVAWPGFGGLWFGQGEPLQVGGGGYFLDNVAVAPTKDGAVVAYYNSVNPLGGNPVGVFVQTARPSGYTSPPTEAPNWGSSAIALTDRPGRDGQFLAYLGKQGEVYLWRVASAAPLTVGTAPPERRSQRPPMTKAGSGWCGPQRTGCTPRVPTPP